MLKALRPFILVAADARRPQDYPDDVRELYFQRDRQRCRSNITVFVLDTNGKLVHSFAGMPGVGQPVGQFQQKMPGHCLREIETAKKLLGTLPTSRDGQELALPTVKADGQPAGVRIYLRFGANHIDHFKVPVVEAVALAAAERKALEWSAKQKTIAATTLKGWLRECYPPAVMDSMEGIKTIAGNLTWKPAGEDSQFRYALLSGTVSFEMDNKNRGKYQGPLEMVLKYPKTGTDFVDVKGLLTTKIPRQNPEGRIVERVDMMVAFEAIRSGQ